MSKSKAIKAINDYKDFYTGLVSKRQAILANKDYSDKWKHENLELITTKYWQENDYYKDQVREALNELKSSVSAKRQANLAKSMASAEAVSMIVAGIANNAYTEEMLEDVLAVYKDNPFALSAIRGALLKNDKPEMQSIGIRIPCKKDNVADNLDKINMNLNDLPSINADASKDWNVGFAQNGTTFDGWADYINENIADD